MTPLQTSSDPEVADWEKPLGAACFTRRLGGASFQAPVFFARRGDFQSPTGKAVSSRPVFFAKVGNFFETPNPR